MEEDRGSDSRILAARLTEALALKSLPRAGWVRAGVSSPESVAAHSWGVAWLVLVLCPSGLDRGRALAMAVIHDLAEARTGDITPHDGIDADVKHDLELEALESLLGKLPGAGELRGLWLEFEERRTPEGRFVRACDKLDMALQARRYAAEQSIDPGEFVRSALASLDDETHRGLATA